MSLALFPTAKHCRSQFVVREELQQLLGDFTTPLITGMRPVRAEIFTPPD